MSILFLLEEEMFHARLFSMLQEAFYIHLSLTELGALFANFVHVLEVPEGESTGIGTKIVKRIVSGSHNPAKVHLHSHQGGIGIFQEHVVQDGAIHGVELRVMVVIAEMQPRLFALLPQFVEGFGGLLVMVDGLALGGEDGRNDVLLACFGCLIQGLLPVIVDMDMSAAKFHAEV